MNNEELIREIDRIEVCLQAQYSILKTLKEQKNDYINQLIERVRNQNDTTSPDTPIIE